MADEQPKLTAEQKRWQAESDAHTLKSVELLRDDPARMKAARKVAPRLAKVEAKEAVAMQKVAKKNVAALTKVAKKSTPKSKPVAKAKAKSGGKKGKK